MFVGKWRKEWIGRLAVYEEPCTNWKGQDYAFTCDTGYWLMSNLFFNNNFVYVGDL
jgi:hypothetical protein